MKLVHTFTPDEQRVVTAAQQKFRQVIEVIADLYQLKGNIALAPDLAGLVETGNNVQGSEGDK